MAHTFEELVEMQRASDQAYTRVQRLQNEHGRPTEQWSEQQSADWETAWRAWVDLARQVQAAVTDHAQGEEKPRNEVEAAVKEAARHPKGG